MRRCSRRCWRSKICPAVDFGRGPWCAVLMTSGNAARALSAHPRRDEIMPLRCFAVGRQTAEAARRAGFADVISADGDGGDLAQLAASVSPTSRCRCSISPETIARATWRRSSRRPALSLETVVVYRAVAAQRSSPKLAAALTGGRDRRRPALLPPQHRHLRRLRAHGGTVEAATKLRHFCLSGEPRNPWRRSAQCTISVAAGRDEQAMLDLISEAFK